jgi:ATP-dependent Lon protease
MTGEMTLTGQVLPIGGLKEKSLAAQRAGISTVIAPSLNEADVEEIPEHLRRDLTFVFVDHIDEVLEVALEAPSSNGRRRSSAAANRRV